VVKKPVVKVSVWSVREKAIKRKKREGKGKWGTGGVGGGGQKTDKTRTQRGGLKSLRIVILPAPKKNCEEGKNLKRNTKKPR